MSVAWTTILVIVLLLPGLLFFVAYWSSERYSREIVKSSAIGEIGLAVFVALLIHFICSPLLLLICSVDVLKLLIESEHLPKDGFALISSFYIIALYLILSSIIGYFTGRGAALLVRKGLFPSLMKHKWTFDLIREIGAIDEPPKTSLRAPLFKTVDHLPERSWEHLMVTGDSIANVLFDPVGPKLTSFKEGTEDAVDDALAADAALNDQNDEPQP